MPIPRYRIHAKRDDDTWEWIDSRMDRTAALNLFDQYKRDGVSNLKLIDGVTNKVITQTAHIVRPELLVLSDGKSWGLSTAGPNPPPEEYLACNDEQSAREVKAAYDRGDIQPFLRAAGVA